MSKFLKFVVNIILMLAILVAGGLLIPPFAGVTTVIVDDVNMNTNLSKGSVTYALDKSSEDLKEGNKVLVSEEGGQYVYEVTSVSGDKYILEDKLSTDGQTQEKAAGSMVKKVVFTVPLIGYVSMALRTTEGLIIVGLAVVFVIILFVLAEIWKKDEDEEDEDEDGEADEEEQEEAQLSRREQKKAQKAAKKAARKARKAGQEENGTEESPKEETIPRQPVQAVQEEPGEEEPADAQKDFFEEVGSAMAADVAGIMSEQAEEKEAAASAEPEAEIPAGKKLAMPAYTKEELLEKAQKAGDEPKVTEDGLSGITLLDYSDLL